MGCTSSGPAACVPKRIGRPAWTAPPAALAREASVLEHALDALEQPPTNTILAEQPINVEGPRAVVKQLQQPAVQRLAVSGGHRVCQSTPALPFEVPVTLAKPGMLTEVEVAAARGPVRPHRLEVRVEGALVAVGYLQEPKKPRLGAASGRESPLRCRLEVDEAIDKVGAFTLRVTSYEWDVSVEEGIGCVEILEVVPWGLPAGSDRPFRRLIQPPRYWGIVDEPLSSRFELRNPSQVSVFQRMLDETWKARATRDRQGAMPRRLVVKKVQRIEAPVLWNRFSRKRRQLSRWAGGCKALEQLGSTDGAGLAPVRTQRICEAAPELMGPCERGVNEHYLFHGTSPTGALGIIQSGFDMSKAGSSTGLMLGPGAYFAEASSKFDEYAKPDELSGMRAVLVCRVLCGNMFRALGKPDPAMLADRGFAAKYDGILGDREASVGTYREFVVFTPEQVYPEYLVIYDREEQG